MAPVVRVFHLNKASSSILNIEDLYAVVVPHQQVREVFRVIAWHFIYLEVKGVLIALRNAPGHFGADLFLCAVDHIKLLIVLDTHYKFVWRVLYASWDIALREVGFCEWHYEFKCSAFRRVSLQFSEEHAVIATETDFTFARRHYNVKDSVHLKRFRLKYFTHIVNLYNVNVAEVLTEDKKLFLDAIVLIFKKLDIVDTLLQLFIVFFLKSIDIEDEKMPIVAADPGQVIVHAATEKTMARRLLHDNRAEFLVIHM